MAARRYRVVWRGHGAVLETDEPALAGEIAESLALAAEPVAADEDTAVGLRLGRGASGYDCCSPHGVRTGLARNAALNLALELLGHALLEQTEAAVIHAAAFRRDDAATLCFGASGAGKTRLAFAAWRRGLSILGDDRLVIEAGRGTVAAFPKCLKLRLADSRPGTLSALGLERAKGFVDDSPSDRRFVMARAQAGIAGYEETLAIGALVWLERRAEKDAALTPLAPAQALPLLMGEVVPPDPAPMALVRLIKAKAQAGRLYRLRVGPEAIEEALELLLLLRQ